MSLRSYEIQNVEAGVVNKDFVKHAGQVAFGGASAIEMPPVMNFHGNSMGGGAAPVSVEHELEKSAVPADVEAGGEASVRSGPWTDN
jgi:hypothetical protein